MKYFKIYDENYPLSPTSDEPADMYGWNNDLVEDKPKGAVVVGYVTMDDGSTIECYAKKSGSPAIAIIILVVCLGLVGFIVYFGFIYKGEGNPLGTLVEVPVNQNIVHYDGYMRAQNGQLAVDFTNGEQESVIKITGDGIETQVVTIGANEHLDYIPVKVTSADGAIEATLHIKSGQTTVEYPVVVENGDATNENDLIDPGSGYWDKEEIFYEFEPIPESK